MRRLPLTVIGGFLGAGKTTRLNRLPVTVISGLQRDGDRTCGACP